MTLVEIVIHDVAWVTFFEKNQIFGRKMQLKYIYSVEKRKQQ